MFVSKLGDALICDNGVYKVVKQFIYKDIPLILVQLISTHFDDIITQSAPIYIAREIISGDSLTIDILEDKKLIDEILKFLGK